MRPAAEAVTPLDNYVQRVETAAKIAADVADNEHSQEEDADLLRQVADLLPTTEDIARDAQGKDITHVDNAWLHRAIETLDRTDNNKRASQIVDIANRLEALSRRLQESSAPDAAANATPERLQRILARAEYQPEEKKESAIQSWLRKIQQRIRDLLAKLFLKNSAAPGVNSTSLQVLRWVIILALIASLAWAAILFLRRFRLRQAKLHEESEEDTREILGEQFDVDITADDLLKTAGEMARKGEYRLAIRRAYLALLYELEQRGKLQLHRAKTNRDYLSELKKELYLYPPVSTLTSKYERVWYGHAAATMDDYVGFIDEYREVAK
ncbi:MAG: DUF4129 domain-containing protein [Blastocatellia bacterium]